MRWRLERRDHTLAIPQCRGVETIADPAGTMETYLILNFHVAMESTPDDLLTVSLDGEPDMAHFDWVQATLAAAAPTAA